MDMLKYTFGVLSVLVIYLYLMGKETFTNKSNEMMRPENDYMLYKLCPVGFGLMRHIKILYKIHIESVYQMYRSRFDDENEINAHNDMFIAQEISTFLCGAWFVNLFLILEILSGHREYVRYSFYIGVFLVCCFAVNFIKKMKANEDERIDLIKDDLPDLINRIVILLNSGMPMVKVFQNIGGLDENSPLSEELHRVNIDIINYKNVVYALARMQKRCHCYEISRLYNIVEVAVTKGANGISEMLTDLALELWENKRNNIRKKSAALGQKLMFPTLIMFVIVLVVVIVPAVISLKMM